MPQEVRNIVYFHDLGQIFYDRLVMSICLFTDILVIREVMFINRQDGPNQIFALQVVP